MNVLKVEGLCKNYGKQEVLKNITFSLSSGEIVGFIGPNGAGKSTTMKCISNLIFASSGTIEICGYDLAKERDLALTKISAQIESPSYYSEMSGKDHIELMAGLSDCKKEKVNEIIKFMNLGNKLNTPVGKYSMGMKQRLSLGMALLKEPSLLLLDEPTNGLDVNGIGDLRRILKRLASEKGMGLLFSSHQLNEITKICNRILFIKNGELVSLDNSKVDTKKYILLTDDNEKACEILRKKYTTSIVENEIEVSVNDEGNIQEILKLLMNEEIEIIDITRQTFDLETYYNELLELE